MKNLEHLFVPYEIALKLKEKGFKETCFGLYDDIKVLHTNKKYVFVEDELNIIAPLYQQVVDWFREKHKINFNVIGGFHDFSISIKLTGTVESKSFYGSYYEVLKKAIEEALKLI